MNYLSNNIIVKIVLISVLFLSRVFLDKYWSEIIDIRYNFVKINKTVWKTQKYFFNYLPKLQYVRIFFQLLNILIYLTTIQDHN